MDELKRLALLELGCELPLSQIPKDFWLKIVKKHQLSEDFMRKYDEHLDWLSISFYQKLSEEFIRESNSKLSWTCISMDQKLSEQFIIDFKDEVDWFFVSKNQNLSESFIRQYQSEIYWESLVENKPLSDDFLVEFKHKIPWKEYFISQQATVRIFARYFTYSGLELNDNTTSHLTNPQIETIQKIIDVKKMFSNNVLSH